MPDHKILVSIVDGAYQYTDETTDGNRTVSKTHHVKNNEKISWRSDDGDLTIHFTGKNPIGQPNPFTVFNHLWSPPRKLHGTMFELDKYDATIQGYATDDPYVLFDDGLLDESIGVGELQAIAGQAADSIGELITTLTTQAERAPRHDPKALFFPHGITSITVNLTVGPAKVEIALAGPNSEG